MSKNGHNGATKFVCPHCGQTANLRRNDPIRIAKSSVRSRGSQAVPGSFRVCRWMGR